MRYIDDQFEWPILWRIGGGPRGLRSLDEALQAIDVRLEEIEGRLVYGEEVTALMRLRGAVETADGSRDPADIRAAVAALRAFAATYRQMVAIPAGQSLDALFAFQDARARRGRGSDDAEL